MNNSIPDNRDVFDIKEKLAVGAFGSTIFKAYNAALGQVAIAKKYPANFTNDYASFMNTLDQIRECKSPNVVSLYGYYKAVKNFWVVMEFCHGFSLHKIMSDLNRPFKETQIRTIMSHVLRGLEALHVRDIVHTRVKSSNILITTFGVCKLAEPSPQVHVTDNGVNVEGVVGNAYWTAPEVLLQQGYRTASDIWSLGITTIELGERHPPYAETHPSRVSVTIPSKPPPELLNPDIWSKYLKDFITQCLQKNPNQRLSASQLQHHKMIKKSDYKGMQTTVQKFLKLYQQGSRFYSTEATPIPPKSDKKVEEIPLDDGNWTESGTLVWSPQQQLEDNPPPKRTSSLPTPGPYNPPPKRTSSLPTPGPGPRPASDLRHTKSTPGPGERGGSNGARSNKPSEKRKSRGSGGSADSFVETDVGENNCDTVKQGGFIQPPSKPADSPEIRNLAGPLQPLPVPRPSKTPENSQQIPRPKASSDPGEPYKPYKTVKVKESVDYTPSYMAFYQDTAPALVEEEPANSRRLVRRNSIDERGVKRDKVQEELRRDLLRVEMEYCSELDLLKQYFLEKLDGVHREINRFQEGELSSLPNHNLNFYKKLHKHELSLMLTFMEFRHTEELRNAKEHYDLEHRFLMNALKNASDKDEEVRYHLGISENNEMQNQTATNINRRYQRESDDLMRSIERIDCADAIAEE